MSTPKPFCISKVMVKEAYDRVKANHGAAGIDRQRIEDFEEDLKGNLYVIWNRMSSGSYFPQPIRAVEIPKKGQGVRILGIPTIADRVAQTVVQLILEPKVEPLFHPDSYGYRPKRSALDAVGVCRERCWKTAWVLDIDIKSFFDTVNHELLLRAVAWHTDEKWILLYVRRWLTAPLAAPDGTLSPRTEGTPQGSPLSPLLANIFLHYAFDMWMKREFPDVQFERYCDDVVVHCVTQQQATHMWERIGQRLRACQLELHPEKTRIVYCKDAHRRMRWAHTRFTFLGFTFRARTAKDKEGTCFTSFLPAVSDEAKNAIRAQIRKWRLHLCHSLNLHELANLINVTVQGWINYYGRYYVSELMHVLGHINDYLLRWAQRKYTRMRTKTTAARQFMRGAAMRQPDLFVHWKHHARP